MKTRAEITAYGLEEAEHDRAPETVTVEPLEYRLQLRLKQGRFLWTIGDQLGDLQAHLDRVSKYAVRRLQRKYPALGVSRPVWSVDRDSSLSPHLQRHAFCRFDYLDLSPYADGPLLRILPQQTHQIAISPNRAARRA